MSRATDACEVGRRAEETAVARRRSDAYRLLARFFRREPDSGMVDYLRNPAVIEQLAVAGMQVSRQELLGPERAQVAGRLAEDYTSLFISPGDRILLNESVHRDEDRTLMGSSTARVAQVIRSLGLTLDDRWGGLPDHLSVEFEIMQKLTAVEAELRERGEDAAVALCARRQRMFLQDHLGIWVPGVCAAIEARAATSFYRALARFTRRYVHAEHRAALSSEPPNARNEC